MQRDGAVRLGSIGLRQPTDRVHFGLGSDRGAPS